MNITARKAIEGALKILGVLDPVETMKPEQSEQGLDSLNDLIDLMIIDSLFIYATQNVSASFSGASATIGPSGVFSLTNRPVKINHGFYRKSGLDYNIQVLTTREQYDGITQKGISTEYPNVLWYDPQIPLGTVYVWPVPSDANTYYLNVDVLLSEFADLDTSYSIPPGYGTFLKYELARMMAPIFQVEMPREAEQIRQKASNLIKRSNVVVPRLTNDALGMDGRRYNILSNQFEDA